MIRNLVRSRFQLYTTKMLLTFDLQFQFQPTPREKRGRTRSRRVKWHLHPKGPIFFFMIFSFQVALFISEIVIFPKGSGCILRQGLNKHNPIVVMELRPSMSRGSGFSGLLRFQFQPQVKSFFEESRDEKGAEYPIFLKKYRRLSKGIRSW